MKTKTLREKIGEEIKKLCLATLEVGWLPSPVKVMELITKNHIPTQAVEEIIGKDEDENIYGVMNVLGRERKWPFMENRDTKARNQLRQEQRAKLKTFLKKNER